jgi:hypothetical protein
MYVDGALRYIRALLTAFSGVVGKVKSATLSPVK